MITVTGAHRLGEVADTTPLPTLFFTLDVGAMFVHAQPHFSKAFALHVFMRTLAHCSGFTPSASSWFFFDGLGDFVSTVAMRHRR